MNTVVWKFRVTLFSSIGAGPIRMPKGARIIHAGADPSGEPCVWVECIPNEETETEIRFFTVIGTGWKAPNKGRHIASYVDGSFVWHIYEVTETGHKET